MRKPALSLDVRGPAEGRADNAPGPALVTLLFARFNLDGLWRGLEVCGEVGSVLTTTFGICAPLCLLIVSLGSHHSDSCTVILVL